MSIGLIAKAVIGAAVAAAGSVTAALQDGHIELVEWVTIAASFLVAFAAVWAVPNLPTGVRSYGKAITAALVAGLGALATALTSGGWPPSADEWVVIVLALLSGAGLVYTAPNAPTSVDIQPANRVL